MDRTDFAIRIDGLKQFNGRLRKLDTSLPKAVRVALNDVAELIVDDAKPKVVKQTGRAASTMKPRSTQKLARIVAGGRKAPYYPWLDFGGRVGRKKATKRAFLKEGRYLYKTYFDSEDEIARALSHNISNVARRAGLAVDRGR